MATYLLKATDDDMDRWKADAEAAGRSFADHIRARLNAKTSKPASATGKAAKGVKPGALREAVRRPAKSAGKVRTDCCPHGRAADQYCSRCD